VRVGAASDAVFAVFVAAKRVATMAAVASVVSFFNHVGLGVLALTRTIVRGDHGLSLEAAS
jgi:hypothetical protein